MQTGRLIICQLNGTETMKKLVKFLFKLFWNIYLTQIRIFETNFFKLKRKKTLN